MSTANSPDMFSELTREELATLTLKMDRAAELGGRTGYDQGVTSEIHGIQANLYDARAAAFYAAGPAAPGQDASLQAGVEPEREAEAAP